MNYSIAFSTTLKRSGTVFLLVLTSSLATGCGPDDYHCEVYEVHGATTVPVADRSRVAVEVCHDETCDSTVVDTGDPPQLSASASLGALPRTSFILLRFEERYDTWQYGLFTDLSAADPYLDLELTVRDELSSFFLHAFLANRTLDDQRLCAHTTIDAAAPKTP